MENNIVERKAQVKLEKGYESAEKLLKDHDAVERFLQRLEKKLKVIPLRAIGWQIYLSWYH